MLNEEKIKIMTKLARYEQGDGKKSIHATKYYKNDFFTKSMIGSFFAGVFSYILLVLFWVIFRVEYYTNNISKLNITSLVFILGILFVVFMVLYMFLSYYVFSVRYRNYRKGLSVYNEELKNLHGIYKLEGKILEERNQGE